MPQFQITHPDGRVVTVEGESAPTEQDAAGIFASLKPSVTNNDAEKFAARTKQGLKAPKGKFDDVGNLQRQIEDIVTQAGPATAGMFIGGPPLAMLLGGMGNTAVQARRMAEDDREVFKPGQLAAATLLSGMPGPPVGATGARVLAQEAGKQGLAGLAGKVAETAIDEGRLPTGKESLLAAGIPAIGGVVAGKLGSKGADTIGRTERETLEAGKAAGYVVTPSSISDSAINRRLESLAGKAAVAQGAAIKNQEITDKLAKQALGLPERAELTMTTLRNVRDQAAIPYQKLEQLSAKAQSDLDALTASLEAQAGGDSHQLAILMADPKVKAQMKPLLAQAGADVNALREARFDARKQFENYKQSGSPEALEKARASSDLAETLENRIEVAAQSSGDPDLLNHLREARARIAKSYEVERALNFGTGEVSAPIVGRSFDRSPEKMTDELRTIGSMAEAYPSVMREGSKIPTPGVSKVEAGTAALLATLGVGATHSPAGIAIGALPLLSGPTRALLLSRPYQKILTAEPFAMPNAATATRLLAQSAGQEASR